MIFVILMILILLFNLFTKQQQEPQQQQKEQQHQVCGNGKLNKKFMKTMEEQLTIQFFRDLLDNGTRLHHRFETKVHPMSARQMCEAIYSMCESTDTTTRQVNQVFKNTESRIRLPSPVKNGLLINPRTPWHLKYVSPSTRLTASKEWLIRAPAVRVPPLAKRFSVGGACPSQQALKKTSPSTSSRY